MRRWLLSLGLILLPLVLQFTKEHGAPSSESDLIPHIAAADWFADDLNVTITSKEGLPVRRLFADKVLHFSATASTDLFAPVYSLYQPQQYWILTAAQGKAWHGKNEQELERLDLWSDVVVEQFADKNAGLRLETTEMTFLPQENQATSPAKVDLYQQRQHLSGQGMEADLSQQSVKLLQQVHSYYEPQHES